MRMNELREGALYDDDITLNRSCPKCGTMWAEVYSHHASVVFPTVDAA